MFNWYCCVKKITLAVCLRAREERKILLLLIIIGPANFNLDAVLL